MVQRSPFHLLRKSTVGDSSLNSAGIHRQNVSAVGCCVISVVNAVHGKCYFRENSIVYFELLSRATDRCTIYDIGLLLPWLHR